MKWLTFTDAMINVSKISYIKKEYDIPGPAITFFMDNAEFTSIFFANDQERDDAFKKINELIGNA